jgi:hypothetical protein
LVSEVAVPGRRSSPLWWIYFWLYAATLVSGAYLFLFRLPLSPISVLSLLFELIGLFCLYCFLVGEPVISRTFWVTFTIFYTCKLTFSVALFLRTLTMPGLPWSNSRESLVALLALGSLPLVLPALTAFWLYSFRSPDIWARLAERPPDAAPRAS